MYALIHTHKYRHTNTQRHSHCHIHASMSTWQMQILFNGQLWRIRDIIFNLISRSPSAPTPHHTQNSQISHIWFCQRFNLLLFCAFSLLYSFFINFDAPHARQLLIYSRPRLAAATCHGTSYIWLSSVRCCKRICQALLYRRKTSWLLLAYKTLTSAKVRLSCARPERKMLKLFKVAPDVNTLQLKLTQLRSQSISY